MTTKLLNKEQSHVIRAITFGNILEWFDVYSFAYLSSVLAKNFFPAYSSTAGLFLSFLVFGCGFITRPIGGILFGRIGDRIGRKKAFVLSIVLLTIPTFIMGILPTCSSWGIYAPITLFILRLIQSIPTGGEIPGTICFLYENAEPHNKRFITSWNAVGNQIGALIAIIECVVMDAIFPEQFFLEWGWRISFITGGLIGLFGIYLRHTLHETPVFERLKKTHRIDKESVLQLIRHHKSKLFTGTAFGMIDAATFYLIATYIPSFIGTALHLDSYTTFLVSFIMITITTILLPIFGYWGDKFNNRTICMSSAICVILLLYPLSYALAIKNIYLLITLGFLFLIPIIAITSLIAYLLGNLFPAPVRFTGVGITVNLADGIIGGFTPSISIFLVWLTGHESAFLWYILVCALISLYSYKYHIKS